MTRYLRAFVVCSAFLIALASPVFAQGSSLADGKTLNAFRAAVLKGDQEAASAILQQGLGRDRASSAVYEAALLEPRRRAEAMLQICRVFLDDPSVDRALVAGCAALLASQDRSDLVPGLEPPDWADSKSPEGYDVPSLIRGFRAVVARRRGVGDAKLIDDARWMLRALSLTNADGEVIRVAPGGEIPVPAPLKQAMTVRWFAWDFKRPCEGVYKVGADPVAETVLAAGVYGHSIPAPKAGVYVLELASALDGWSRLRRVLVSELDLVVQAWPGSIAVLACLGTVPQADVALTLRWRDVAGKEHVFETVTDASGMVVIEQATFRDRLRITAQKDGHRAQRSLSNAGSVSKRSPQLRAHTTVDRPLYRPGETVQGRVIVLRQDPQSNGAFVSSPFGGQAIELRFWAGSKAEKVIRGKTDASGVLRFEQRVPLSAAHRSVRLQVVSIDTPLDMRSDALKPELHVSSVFPFSVKAFRRPPILASLKVPASVAHGDPVSVLLRARYSAGGDCVGLGVEVIARLAGFEHKLEGKLNDEGELRFPVDLDALPLPAQTCAVTFTARFYSPSGQIVSKRARTVVRALVVKIKGKGRKPRSKSIRIDFETARHVAGQVQKGVIRGPEGAVLLVCAGTQSLSFTKVYVLDKEGQAVFALDTAPWDAPGIRIVVARLSREVVTNSSLDDFFDGQYQHDRRGSALDTMIVLESHAEPLLISCDATPLWEPGAKGKFDLQVKRGGLGVPGMVTISVVDESLYQLASDRTEDPQLTLRARQPSASVHVQQTIGRTNLWHVLGHMMSGGELPEPEEMEESAFDSNAWNSAIGLGGGAGGSYGGKSGSGSGSSARLRRDYRATAWFGHLTTDAQGRVQFEFPFPDDLARWRITVTAVDETAAGAIARFHTQTSLPLSVTQVLPRILREGDKAESLVLVQQTDPSAKTEMTLAFESDGDLEVPPLSRSITVDGVIPSSVPFMLKAKRRGQAKVRVRTNADASERALPVLADEVLRAVFASERVVGSKTLRAPRDFGEPRTQVLTLLGSRDAILRQASDYLEAYPYGCVEQILSRLTPLIVAARANRLAGRPLLSEAQALRVELGFGALQSRRVSDAGFGWWRSNAIDRGMTALALTTLAEARDAGIDPERYDLVLHPGAQEARKIFVSKGSLSDATTGRVQTLLGEYLVAALRYQPTDKILLRSVQEIVEHRQSLPSGFLARAGIALRAASDHKGSRAVMERLLAGERILQSTKSRGLRYPGESQVARIAHRLELIGRIDSEHVDCGRSVTKLLQLHRDGRFGNTFSTAAAILALTHDAERVGQKPTNKPMAVVVQSAGRRYGLSLAKNNGFRGEVALSSAEDVTVTSPDGREVFAVLRAEIAGRGSVHKGWKTPIRVARYLGLLSSTTAGSFSSEDLGTEVPKGRVLEMVISMTSDEDVAYLVADCPIPAGFEVLGNPSGWELHDDRAVRLIRSMSAGVEKRVKLRLVAAHRGSVAWPPARVEAMYLPEFSGASAGSRLDVVEIKAKATASAAEQQLLSAAAFDKVLKHHVAVVLNSRSPKVFGRGMIKLQRFFFSAGALAIRNEIPVLARRYHNNPRVLRGLVQIAESLPDAPALEAACLEVAAGPDGHTVDVTTAGFLLFTSHATRHHKHPRYRSTLSAMYGKGVFAGLSRAERRPLLLKHYGSLVSKPWQAEARLRTLRSDVMTSDGVTIPDSLKRWVPVLRESFDLVTSEPNFDHLDFYNFTASFSVPIHHYGAARGAQYSWLESTTEDLRWQLLSPWLSQGGRLFEKHGKQAVLLSILSEARDRKRQIAAFRPLLANAEAIGPRWTQRLIAALPRSLSKSFETELTGFLSHSHGPLRQAAYRSLTREQRKKLTPAIIALVFEDRPVGMISHLLELGPRADAAIITWLNRAGRKAVVLKIPVGRVIERFGTERLGQQPLSVLRLLSEDERILQILAKSTYSDTELSQELVSHQAGVWRRRLVRVLAGRGVAKVPFAADDSLRSYYSDILASGSGNKKARAAVRERLVADDRLRQSKDYKRRKLAMPNKLRSLLVEVLMPGISVDDCLRYGNQLSAANRADALRGFTLNQWRAWLQQMSKQTWCKLSLMPQAYRSELRAEIWAACERKTKMRNLAIKLLLASEGGETFLRSRLREPMRDEALRKRLCLLVFQDTGRRVDYLQNDGSPQRFGTISPRTVRRRLEREGFALSLSPDEQAHFKLWLLRRGI